MAKSRLAIVVLNWNGPDDSIECLRSLIDQKSLTPDIILIDNKSSDNSVYKLEKFIQSTSTDSIHFIKNSFNYGFAGGINIGIKYALSKEYEYIGTLNSDAKADKQWTTQLVNELYGDKFVGIATGILATSDRKRIDTTGEQYTTWGIPGPRGRNSSLDRAPKESGYVFGSTGGGFIARSDALRKVGLFDEKFFMYFEDVDLSFRMQLAGYKIRYTPTAVAYHKISASTKKVPGLAVTQTFKNLPMLFVKNIPWSLWPQILPRFTLAYGLILGNAVLRGKGIYAIKGWLMSLTLIPHMWRERNVIQKNRRVTDEYINSIILHDIPPEQTGLRKFRKIFTGKP